MNSLKFGKKFVIAVISLLLLTNIISKISMVINGQADTIATTIFFGLIGFAILGTILYYFYAGNKLAKWMIVISTLMSGVSGLLKFLLSIASSFLLSSNDSLSVIDFINLPLYIIYIAIGVVLIVSGPVNKFLENQREENQKEGNDNSNDNM